MTDVSSIEKGLIFLEEAIVKARKIVQGYPDTKFFPEEYMACYDCVFRMCTGRESSKAQNVLYAKFRTSLEESIELAVLPSLVKKKDVDFLREFDMMWSNYKKMGTLLCKMFRYLDRFFIPLNPHLNTLEKLAVSCFRDLVLGRLYNVLGEAVIAMIRKQREGIPIDTELLKSVFKVIAAVEFDISSEDSYYTKLESSFLSDLSAYYAVLAPRWLMEFSALEYINNAYRHLKIESERASDYLHSSTIVKLNQVWKLELLEKYASKLAEKVEAESHGMKTEYQGSFSRSEAMTDISTIQEGLIFLEEAIVKARKIVQGYPDTYFSPAEYMAFYDCVFRMCAGRESSKAQHGLYAKFRISLEESIELAVVPSLVNKKDVDFLREFDLMWSNYKKMGTLLCKMFDCLDRFFIPRNPHLNTLEKVAATGFRDLVLGRLFNVLGEAVVAMIRKQREGIPIDKELLKSVFKVIAAVEFDISSEDSYYIKLESSFLSDLSAYYAGLAPRWLMEFSAVEYITNAYRHLEIETERASDYLRPSTVVKLNQVWRLELLDKYASILTEKGKAESHGMKTEHQEMVSKCSRMNLEDESSITN